MVTVEDEFGVEDRLATYGTLSPGRSNAHVLGGLAGTWTQGTVRGHLFERGWGAAAGYPGIDEAGPTVDVHVFTSRDLPAHWDRLDRFEGPGYRRLQVLVHIDGSETLAYVYALAEE